MNGDRLRASGDVAITDPWGHVFVDPPDQPTDPAPQEHRQRAADLAEIPDDTPF